MPGQLLRCCASFVSGMRAQEYLNSVDYADADKDLKNMLIEMSEKYNALIMEYDIDNYEFIKERYRINMTLCTSDISREEVKKVLKEANLYYEGFKTGLNVGLSYDSEW